MSTSTKTQHLIFFVLAASPTPGEVQVRVTNPFGAPISSTVTFTYTEENPTEKGDIKPQDIRNMDVNDLPLALMEIAQRMGEMSLKLKEEASQPGKLGKH